MLKKCLSALLCSVFCAGSFVCTPAHAVRCGQKGRTSIFEHTDAEDISRTVNAIWEVYNVLNKHRGRTMPPEVAADLIVHVLDDNGLGSFETRNGTKLSHAIACAIFHARPGLVDIVLDKETNTFIHWFHPVSCDELSVATYIVVESFKKAGYVDGANNYVALLSQSDVIIGNNSEILDHLCAIPTLESSGGRSAAFCKELMDFLGAAAWPD